MTGVAIATPQLICHCERSEAIQSRGKIFRVALDRLRKDFPHGTGSLRRFAPRDDSGCNAPSFRGDAKHRTRNLDVRGKKKSASQRRDSGFIARAMPGMTGCGCRAHSWRPNYFVMPGLVPGIHVLSAFRQLKRGGREESGHDRSDCQPRRILSSPRLSAHSSMHPLPAARCAWRTPWLWRWRRCRRECGRRCPA
jgi:hypothetical protein